jgi:hypothetical protein
MSLGQSRLLLLQQLAPESAHYNVCYPLRLEGRLDRQALDRAVRRILDRHEVLRARFPDREGLEMEVMERLDAPVVRVIDLSGLPAERQADAADSIYRRFGGKPFDLVAGPSYRFELLRFAADAHMLLCALHHIVTDGHSGEIFLLELQTFYRQEMGIPVSALAPLRLQYPAYAGWQRDQMAEDATGLQYWKERLAGAQTSLEIPTVFARPERQSFEGARVDFMLPERLAEGLRELARKEQCTVFMVLLALVSGFRRALRCWRAPGTTKPLQDSGVVGRRTPAP